MLTADFRSGQCLSILEIEGNKATCKIVTRDKQEWFDQRHLQEDTEFLLLTYSGYGISESDKL